MRERRAPGAFRTAGPQTPAEAQTRAGSATRAGTATQAGTALIKPVVPTTGSDRQMLQLQRQVGNRAVVQLLVQGPEHGPRRPAGLAGPFVAGPLIVGLPTSGPKDARPQRADSPASGSPVAVQRAGSSPEFAPVTTVTPAGSLTDGQWSAAVAAARAKPSAPAYEPLIRDIAIAAGMSALGSGFVPAQVPVTDGRTARPGLNMSMDRGDKPGHAGWVDGSGAYGVPFRLDRTKPPDRQIAVILSVGILKGDKGLTLPTVRHEMVHARHKQKVLEAVRVWQALPARGRPSFSEWLTQQTRQRKGAMSALDAVLIGKGVQDLSVNTEVLAYVESFVNGYHRHRPTLADAGPAFFDLLGAVQTDRFEIWQQADPAVRAEALTRLREYHATLDLPHQTLWRQWLDGQRERVGKDRYRKDFLTRLGAFVT